LKARAKKERHWGGDLWEEIRGGGGGERGVLVCGRVGGVRGKTCLHGRGVILDCRRKWRGTLGRPRRKGWSGL